MADALRRGYATSSTDTGHAGGSASFALGHPEKLIDFGYRVRARDDRQGEGDHRRVLRQRAEVSYWNGCSAGGRQALKEAQRFPADFDGIIAGAPGSTGRAGRRRRVADRAGAAEGRGERIPPAKYAAAPQGGARGVRRARRRRRTALIDDPDALQVRSERAASARAATSPTCLTPPQVADARG